MVRQCNKTLRVRCVMLPNVLAWVQSDAACPRHQEEQDMGKTKVVALATLVGAALALAPLSSAFADSRFDRHWGHGSSWGSHGNVHYSVRGGHGCRGCLWPFGLAAAAVGTVAAAVVNTAAAVVTLPFVALDRAANAAYYASPAAYGPPAATYGDATPSSYYNNAAPAYYAPPARYYNSAPAPVYYAPPAAPAYYNAAPTYNAPPARYYAQPPQYYAQPAQSYAPPAAPAAPGYDYGVPPDYYNQAPPAPGYYNYRR